MHVKAFNNSGLPKRKYADCHKLVYHQYRFGRKSERYIDLDNPQLASHSEATLEPVADEEEGQEARDDLGGNFIAFHSKRDAKNPKKTFAEHLLGKVQIITVEAHQKNCQCGCQKKVINPNVMNGLIIRPRFMTSLSNCVNWWLVRRAATATKPKHYLPKASFTESVLAHIIVSKLDDVGLATTKKKIRKRGRF